MHPNPDAQGNAVSALLYVALGYSLVGLVALAYLGVVAALSAA